MASFPRWSMCGIVGLCLADPESERAIWRAHVEAVVQRALDDKRRRARVVGAIEEMFSKFPR